MKLRISRPLPCFFPWVCQPHTLLKNINFVFGENFFHSYGRNKQKNNRDIKKTNWKHKIKVKNSKFEEKPWLTRKKRIVLLYSHRIILSQVPFTRTLTIHTTT